MATKDWTDYNVEQKVSTITQRLKDAYKTSIFYFILCTTASKIVLTTFISPNITKGTAQRNIRSHYLADDHYLAQHWAPPAGGGKNLM